MKSLYFVRHVQIFAFFGDKIINIQGYLYSSYRIINYLYLIPMDLVEHFHSN